MKLDWSTWLYGLAGYVIGGAAHSVTNSLIAMGWAPNTFNLNSNLSSTLRYMASCFVVSGFISLAFWLKQKPVPDIKKEVTERTATITEQGKTTQIDEKTITTHGSDGKSGSSASV